MGATRTATCAYCKRTFTVPRRPGPAPSYCSHAHRQRAYENRRGNGGRTRLDELSDELDALRARNRRLEYDNRQLREELAATIAEVHRLDRELHPPSPAVEHLTRQPHPTNPQPPPSPPAPTRKRRWTRPTNP
jgi:hypothetical protein